VISLEETITSRDAGARATSTGAPAARAGSVIIAPERPLGGGTTMSSTPSSTTRVATWLT
jgi:hypothetical protein